jgi:hypothetical protein
MPVLSSSVIVGVVVKRQAAHVEPPTVNLIPY